MLDRWFRSIVGLAVLHGVLQVQTATASSFSAFSRLSIAYWMFGGRDFRSRAAIRQENGWLQWMWRYDWFHSRQVYLIDSSKRQQQPEISRGSHRLLLECSFSASKGQLLWQASTIVNQSLVWSSFVKVSILIHQSICPIATRSRYFHSRQCAGYLQRCPHRIQDCVHFQYLWQTCGMNL